MDTAWYSSAQPTIPVKNSTEPSLGSVPVKLTPITGRVSRAKKGVPVHVCEICKPPKTFTRPEHLRRHQLSHKSAQYQCHFPGCDKAFHRQDLLTRHIQRHKQDDHNISRCDLPFQDTRHSIPQSTSATGLLQPSGLSQSTDLVHFTLPTWNTALRTVVPPSDSLSEYAFKHLLPSYISPRAPESGINQTWKTDGSPGKHDDPPSNFDDRTDSGYASHARVPNLKIVGPEIIVPSMSDRSNYTAYSDPSSLSNGRLDNFISEFSEEVAAGLPQSIPLTQLPILSTTLPNLLEEFAGRFGYGDSSQLYSYLMRLVYRYRLQITESVTGAFTKEDSDSDPVMNPPFNENDMPLEDKMSLWQSKENKQDEKPVDVIVQAYDVDAGDDFEYYPELQEYRDAVLNSSAYSWLMSTISTQLQLEMVHSNSNDFSIRHSILAALGDTSITNRRQRPKTYYVTFRALGIGSWLGSQSQDLESAKALSQKIIVVGKESHAYTTTCGKYVRQVWPISGTQIVNLLSSMKQDAHRSIYPRTLSDSTKLVATMQETPYCIQISVTGCSYAIAEIGEQLAWLNTVLSSSHHAFNHNNIVSLQPWSSSSSAFSRSAFPPASNWAVTGRTRVFDLSSFVPTNSSFSHHHLSSTANGFGTCWKDLFGEMILVEGFPIPRRIIPGTGLEISLPVMAALANSQKLAIVSGKFLIKGFSTALIPTRHCDEFIYWYMVSNKNGDHLEFNDYRIKTILNQYPTGLTTHHVENARHILGWCSEVKNNTGTPDANYAIGWSGLGPPKPGLAFEKISIVGGMFITGGASVLIGKKDKAVQLRSRDDYTMRLKWVSKKFVVLYDVKDRRAWLIDGLSAVLHLVRASLKYDLEDPFKSLFLYEPSAFKETHWVHSGKDAAIQVLTNPENMSLPLYAKPESAKEDISISDAGVRTRILSRTKTNYCLKDRIESICDVLEQIMAHQADVATQDGVGFRLKSTPRRHLEGFDFMDIATDEDPFWPRMANLQSSGRGWVDFTRALHAITLFGSGFGELIQPVDGQASTCKTCSVYVEVPKGQDYLAVCVRDIKDIMQKRGSTNTTPWRLIDNIYWHTPDKTFEPCIRSGKPSAKHDRVQILLPATFPKLWGRNFKSPPDLNIAPTGALLFGHSRRFPLRWGDRGDPQEGRPDQELEELESSFQDSGIGTSLASSSLGVTDSSSSRSPASHTSSHGTSRSADGLPSEDEQPVKRRKLQKEPHSIGESSGIGFNLVQAERSQAERHYGRRLSTVLSPIKPWRRKDNLKEPICQ
ncbi:hypothetical protein HD806DRAFT_419274 [Xylariaceae sp. AK1471]|nr:hypothetical protein HD806DRAFT_419274 [Xylariaceae sp. AK1471]